MKDKLQCIFFEVFGERIKESVNHGSGVWEERYCWRLKFMRKTYYYFFH